MEEKRRSKISDFMQEMIDLVNVLPKDVELPDPHQVLEQIRAKNDKIREAGDRGDDYILRNFKEALRLWFKEIKNFKPLRDFDRLFNFLTRLRFDLDPANEMHTVIDVFNAYDRFKETRLVFDYLIERALEHEKAYDQYGDKCFSWQRFTATSGLHFSTLIASGKEGSIDFKMPEIFEHFKGRSLVRFRRCVVCDNVFYARKLNAQTCQRQCSVTLNNQKRLRK